MTNRKSLDCKEIFYFFTSNLRLSPHADRLLSQSLSKLTNLTNLSLNLRNTNRKSGFKIVMEAISLLDYLIEFHLELS